MNMASASHASAFESGAKEVGGHAGDRIADFQRLRLNLYALTLLVDGLTMLAGFLLGDMIRFGRLEGYGLTTFIVMFPTYIAVGLNGNAWSIEALQRPKHSAAFALRAFVLAIAVATVFFFSLKVGADFSRPVFGIGSLISLIFIAGGRLTLGKALVRRYGGSFRREVLILDGITASPTCGEIVIDAASEGLRPDADDPAALDELARALHRSERAIVACVAERRGDWTRALAGANIDVELLTPELAVLPAIGLRRRGTTPSVLVGCGPLRLRNRALKRLLDVGVAGVSVILLALPMLAISAAIKLESGGPIFFTQSRMGRGNRLFRMFKFRTMLREASNQDGDRSVGKIDDRVTRVGRFLRRTSLDELPQLFNVLRGEMSIVGPRPHALGTRAGDRLLWTLDERYWDRHAIKPGLTGLAQVRGLRGQTARECDLTNRLQADLEYIDGWHIGRDITIMLLTIRVLVHPNAF